MRGINRGFNLRTIELDIPSRLPVMTLPETVFFPQAMLPLHISEPEHQTMLRDVLHSHRMFAISSGLSETGNDNTPDHSKQPVATAGMIRACKENPDGSSNLILQGLCRIRCGETITETPYRSMEIEVLASFPGKNIETLLHLKGRLLGCFGIKRRLGGTVPANILSFLKTIEEPDILVDLAASSLCDDASLKQTLLETLDTSERLSLFIGQLKREIAEIRLRRKLQGQVDDDEIWMN